MKDFGKYMEGNITGWTSYVALEKVLWKWHKLTGNEYVEYLGQILRCDPALMNDWAESLKEAIEERGENNIEPVSPIPINKK